MNTTSNESSLLSRVVQKDRASLNLGFALKFSESDARTGSEAVLIHYTRGARKSARSAARHKPKVLRRLSGFLVSIQGKSARVAFIEDNEPILYDLPSDRLLNSGISIPNQPFEMDEVEVASEEGVITGYRFKPLAKPSDAFIETLNLDDDYRRKRDRILKKFAKTQG